MYTLTVIKKDRYTEEERKNLKTEYHNNNWNSSGGFVSPFEYTSRKLEVELTEEEFHKIKRAVLVEWK